MVTDNNKPQSDPWATLDAALGAAATPEAKGSELGDMAFLGRCSTEDNQDPETSRGWQRANAEKFVGPLGGQIVAEFFDIGQSRSVPWDRRPQASALLAELKNPHRTWSAVVVGEGTRCWFGNQFSLTAPRFTARGVDLWVPELGGKYDPRNPSHQMLMSVLGGMSESERQHVQARVRAAMDSQVVTEGRHQGGRAPYGYVVVDGGEHPNPRKAAEGYRLRVLALDEDTAPIVARIFSEYLDGRGDRTIATGLNLDEIPCPSAHSPRQNKHRAANGWQASTVRAILENPRYTGYAVFGRWQKHETLLDPDDVAAGHVVRFRRADPSSIVRSRRQAHPEIVSVETFTNVALLRREHAAGTMAQRAAKGRTRTTGTRTYVLRGMIHCAACGRRMNGAAIKSRTYYRCLARTLTPGAPAATEHPRTVNLRETHVVHAVNGWISELFDPDHRASTVAALVGAQDLLTLDDGRDTLRAQLADVENELERFAGAITAGVDPGAFAERINRASAHRDRLRAELRTTPSSSSNQLDVAAVEKMVDKLGDMAVSLDTARPDRQAALYRALNLDLHYRPGEHRVKITADPGVVSGCVRGGT